MGWEPWRSPAEAARNLAILILDNESFGETRQRA